jgi:hypothetical protein
MACFEYITVADARAEYGDDVTGMTDAAIQRRIDRLAVYLEDQLGHTFGRALIARSSGSETVSVSATALTIGGIPYLFATYPTLYELVTVVNAAGASYSLELLSNLRPDTPSALLKIHTGATCGPDYEDRVVLCVSAMFCRLTGKRESHLFLPLPLTVVNTVVEDLIALTTADYWAIPGDAWLIRKACGCSCACGHAYGRWSACSPGNIGVSFAPRYWGHAPGSLLAYLLDAFGSQAGVAPFESESFGDYKYSRGSAKVSTWSEILGSGSVRQYAIKFQP